MSIILVNYTDEEILKISDDLFKETVAYKAFGNKALFVQKIKDPTIRQKMLR